MPLTLKTTELQYKDSHNVYHGINAVAEKPTADIIADLDVAIEERQDTVEGILDAQETRGAQITSAVQSAVDGIEGQKDTMIASIASVAGMGTDTTLTQSGVAADAKVTGDKIGDLKSALNGSNNVTISLGTWNDLGQKVESATRCSTILIPVVEGDAIEITNGNYKHFCKGYNADKTIYRSDTTYNLSNETVVITTDGYFAVIFADAIDASATIDMNSFNGMVVNIPKIWVEIDKKADTEDVSEIETEVSDIKSDLDLGYSLAIFEVGTWRDFPCEKYPDTKRIRTSKTIHLDADEYIVITTGSYYHNIKAWNEDLTSLIESSNYTATDETYTAKTSRWVVVNFRNADGTTDVNINNFDGAVKIYNTIVSQIPAKLDKVIKENVDGSGANVGVAIADGTFGTRSDTKYIFRNCLDLTSINVKTTYFDISNPAILFYNSSGSVISTVETVTGLHYYGTISIPANAAKYAVNVTALYVSDLEVIESYYMVDAVKQNQKSIDDVKSDINDTARFVLPQYMYGVVGYPSYLYYENIIKNGWLKDYDVSSNDLQNRLECHVITPQSAGEITVPVIRYKGLNVRESSSVTLKAVSATEGCTANVLIIGDSKSEAVAPWNVLDSLLDNDTNMNLTFLGTVTNGPIHREAYSGRSIVNVCDDEYITGTTPNIFYDANVTTTNGHHFSFAKAVQTLGAMPDIVIIDHGANQWAKAWSMVKGCYDDIIESIHTVDSNIKIVIVAQEATGLADKPNYATDGKWALQNTSYTNIEKMIAEYQGKESSNVYLQPQYLSIDLYRDFPLCSLPSSVMAKGETVFCMDNVHPGLNTGIWSPSTDYKYGDWVNRNNKGFGCKRANTNVDPETDNGIYWGECKNLNDGYAKKAYVYYYMLKYLASLQ